MEVTGQEARFRAMFAEEAEGRLATLSELLLELERNGDDQELLSSVFREAHTLKGAAAVVGLADVLRVATPWRRSWRDYAAATAPPPRRRSTPCWAPSTGCESWSRPS